MKTDQTFTEQCGFQFINSQKIFTTEFNEKKENEDTDNSKDLNNLCGIPAQKVKLCYVVMHFN